MFAGNAVCQNNDSCSSRPIKTILFEKNSIRLTTYAKKQLDSALLLIRNNTFCRVEASGGAFCCELCAQRVWDRVEAVIIYLNAKGVARERMIFSFGEIDSERIVQVNLSSDEGPFSIPAPHPGVRKHYSKTKDVYIDGHVLPLEH